MNMMISAILCVLEPVKICTLIYYFMGTNIRHGHPKHIVTALVVCVDIACSILIQESILIYLIFQILIVHTFYNDKIYKLILQTLWAVALIGIIDYYYRVIIELISHNSSSIGSMHRIIVYICTIITIIILGRIYRYFNRENFQLPLYYYILFLVVGIVNGLMLNIYSSGILNEYSEKENLPIISVICIILCVVGFLVCMMSTMIFAIMNRVYSENTKFKEKIIAIQKEHYDNLLLREKDTRQFRHDISDHLYILNDLIESKEYVEASNYLRTLNDNLESVKRICTGNNSIDALISHYMPIYNNKNISFKISGHLPKNTSLDMYDLCTVFSNILKNGAEYSISYMNIDIKYNEHHIFITEENNCNDNLVIDNIMPKTSNKDDALKHGFGLLNISRVVDKYDGYLTINARDGLYKLDIML